MSTVAKISFTGLYINQQEVACLNTSTFQIIQRISQFYLVLMLTDTITLEVDVRKSLSEFNYSKWISGTDNLLIFDFMITLAAIPTWICLYSSVPPGCLHKLFMTFKVNSSELEYRAFIGHLHSLLTPVQFNSLDSTKTLALWNKRRMPISNRIVSGLKFCAPNFPTLSLGDLERLKDTNKWLSDSHVTFGLLDSFRDCAKRNIWGNLKIQLLDTHFWPLLRDDPDRFGDRFRNKVNLLEYDFVLMPLFERNHWRLGIIEKPGQFLEGNTVFHILDSLASNSQSETTEATQLQRILLKMFDGETFREGRITLNHAQVPLQMNDKDCGCFTIYFAQKFFSDPHATISLIKSQFSSVQDLLAKWGLKNSDLTFVRHEMRTLLFQYIDRGDAIVEFQE